MICSEHCVPLIWEVKQHHVATAHQQLSQIPKRWHGARRSDLAEEFLSPPKQSKKVLDSIRIHIQSTNHNTARFVLLSHWLRRLNSEQTDTSLNDNKKVLWLEREEHVCMRLTTTLAR